jgi:hypothetical protein
MFAKAANAGAKGASTPFAIDRMSTLPHFVLFNTG